MKSLQNFSLLALELLVEMEDDRQMYCKNAKFQTAPYGTKSYYWFLQNSLSYIAREIYLQSMQINKRDKTDPIIWRDRSLVDPRIRVNSQIKSIFPISEMKWMFSSAVGKSGRC